MKTFPFVAGLALGVTVLPSLAGQSELNIDEIIISSSRVEQPLRAVGTSVTLISREQLAAIGTVDLVDVLRTSPGVGASNSGGLGKSTSLRIRGEEAYRTKVFIDGMDVSDTSTPQTMPQVQQIMTRGIERVEILRGPQGMMYGADAGGVVNIATRHNEPNSFAGDVALEAGRYDTRSEFAQAGGAGELIDFNVSGLHAQTDGFNATTADNVQSDRDGYENTTLHGRAGIQLLDELRLDAVVRNVDGENQYDGCFGGAPAFAPTHDCADEYHQNSWRLSADWQSDMLGQTLAAESTDIDRENFADGVSSFDYTGAIDRIEYIGRASLDEALQFVYGLEQRAESFSSSFGDAWERDQLGYYLEYQGSFADSVYLTAGVRQDDNDDFDKHTSYRLSAATIISLGNPSLKLKGSYGTGFRAPSLYEVSFNSSPFSLGAPALSEETSEGHDLGAELFFDNGATLTLVYFDQRIDDEIVYFYDPASFAAYYQQASGESRSRGWELGGAVPLSNLLTLQGNYTYNDAEREDDTVRALRPKHQINLGLDATLLGESLKLGVFWRYSDDVTDSTGVTLDDYQLVELSARYFPLDALELSARVENAFDEDYTEVAGYNTPGRAGYVGVSYHF